MNPLSPWVAFTEISLLLAAAFLVGFAVAWVRARPTLRRVQTNIREAQKALQSESITGNH
ncbi:MAG: LapA family protein [Cytophagaceae bacterium]|nr:MAG: LapA family protein [Cytophagaceae bacterium]